MLIGIFPNHLFGIGILYLLVLNNIYIPFPTQIFLRADDHRMDCQHLCSPGDKMSKNQASEDNRGQSNR